MKKQNRKGLINHFCVLFLFSLTLLVFFPSFGTAQDTVSEITTSKVEFVASGEVGDERINVLLQLKNGESVILVENLVLSTIPTTFVYMHKNTGSESSPVAVQIGFMNDNLAMRDGKDRNVIIKDSKVLYNGFNIWTSMIRYLNLDGTLKPYVQDPGRFLGFFTGGVMFWEGYLTLPILYDALTFRAKGVTGTEQLAITVNYHSEQKSQRRTVFNETLSSLGFRQYTVPITLDIHVYSVELHFVNGEAGVQTLSSPTIAIKDGIVKWKGENIMQGHHLFYPETSDTLTPSISSVASKAYTPKEIIKAKYGNIKEGTLFFRGFVKLFADYHVISFHAKGSTGHENMKVVVNEGPTPSKYPGLVLLEPVPVPTTEYTRFDLSVTRDIDISTIDIHFVNDGRDIEDVDKNVFIRDGKVLLNGVNVWGPETLRYYLSGRWSSYINNNPVRFSRLQKLGILAWQGFARIFVARSELQFKVRGTTGVEMIRVTINYKQDVETFFVAQLVAPEDEQKEDLSSSDNFSSGRPGNQDAGESKSNRPQYTLIRPNRPEGYYDFLSYTVPIPRNRPIRSIEMHFIQPAISSSASPLQVEIFNSEIIWKKEVHSTENGAGAVKNGGENLFNSKAWAYSADGLQGWSLQQSGNIVRKIVNLKTGIVSMDGFLMMFPSSN
eukprot:Nk52_evm11s212 gene=Nk52_evmTU11s212